jgi:hypothetical protein
MGTILGSAVLPIALAVTWSKANRLGCVIGALIGFAAGIAAWLIATSVLNHGLINVDVSITFPANHVILTILQTTGGNYEMLAGNLASILVGGAIAMITSIVWPEEFTFATTRAMNAPPGSRFAAARSGVDASAEGQEEKGEKSPTDTDVRSVHELDESELDPVPLEKAFRFAYWSSVVLVSSSCYRGCSTD